MAIQKLLILASSGTLLAGSATVGGLLATATATTQQTVVRNGSIHDTAINGQGRNLSLAKVSESNIGPVVNNRNQFYLNQLETALKYEYNTRVNNQIAYLRKGQTFNMATRLIDPAINYAKATIKDAPAWYNPAVFNNIKVSFTSNDKNTFSFTGQVLHMNSEIVFGPAYFGPNSNSAITTTAVLKTDKTTFVGPAIGKNLLTSYSKTVATVNGVTSKAIANTIGTQFYGQTRVVQKGVKTQFISNNKGISVFGTGPKGVDFTKAITNFTVKSLQPGDYINKIYQIGNDDASTSLLLVTGQGYLYIVGRSAGGVFTQAGFNAATKVAFGGRPTMSIATITQGKLVVNPDGSWTLPVVFGTTTGSIYGGALKYSKANGYNLLNVNYYSALGGTQTDVGTILYFNTTLAMFAVNNGVYTYDGSIFEQGAAVKALDQSKLKFFSTQKLGMGNAQITSFNYFKTQKGASLTWITTSNGVYKFSGGLSSPVNNHLTAGIASGLQQNDVNGIFAVPFKTQNGLTYYSYYMTYGSAFAKTGGIAEVSDVVYL